MNKQVKLPGIQYVIFNKKYNGYIGRYAGYNNFVQNAKLYKSYEAAQDAMHQSNYMNEEDCIIQKVDIELVSAEEWEHEQYLISKEYEGK